MKTEVWYEAIKAAGINIHSPLCEEQMVPIIATCMLQDKDQVDDTAEKLMEQVELKILEAIPVISRGSFSGYMERNVSFNLMTEIVAECRSIMEADIRDDIDWWRQEAIWYESYVVQSQQEDYLYEESISQTD